MLNITKIFESEVYFNYTKNKKKLKPIFNSKNIIYLYENKQTFQNVKKQYNNTSNCPI